MAEAFEDEVEQTVTIGEYIEDMEAAELEADMVLGGDEGKECTYSSGYMKRQAIFSCLTCVPTGNAGVCTACSLACHDGHEVVELWTKRKFRCDCGNSKFNQFSCKLFANKDPLNAENSYNQNYQGSYCTCHRPYPDPEATEQVEMIQCCMCEDWFHENHIGLESSEEIPRDEEGEPLYEDFICQDCALTVSFLNLYPTSIWASSRQSPIMGTNKEKNVLDEPEDCRSSENIENGSCASVSSTGSAIMQSESATVPREMEPCHGEKSAECLGSGGVMTGSNSTSIGKCMLEVDLNSTPPDYAKKKPLFLSKNWRERLCRCGTCCELYAKKEVEYLVDKEDSMEGYEKLAKLKREEKLQKQEGAELNFINAMDHVQKIEILNGIADMKNELASFLESFDSSKPITAADVHGIFENLAKKRQRLL